MLLFAVCFPLIANAGVQEQPEEEQRSEFNRLGGQAVENSAELLNSSKMTRLVSDLKSSTDKCIIIFDVPPVLGTAETLAFSAQVDAALLVIEDGITSRKDIARAVDLLSNTNVVGTVLNKSGRVAP